MDKAPPVDDELAKLLDDALGDFGKTKAATTDDDLDALMGPLDKEATQNAARKFQDMLTQMFEDADNNRAGESADGPGNDREFAEFMAKSEGVVKAKNEAAFLEAFRQLEESPNAPVDELMEMIIATSLSKQVMYPTVREIHGKFGPYLAEKGETLDEQTGARYRRQEQILSLMCQEYERIDEQGEGAGHQNSLLKISAYWEQLQKEGLPPPELTCSAMTDMTHMGESSTNMGQIENCCLM